MTLSVSGAALLVSATLAAAQPTGVFDHSAFDVLLHRLVVSGLVDYDGFQRSPEFPAYLDRLSRADPASLSDPERLAFWINAYNAYTIQLINSHQERESIRNINKTLFIKGHGPWRERLVRAGGQVLHLDNVEHDIIRKQWKEPRIHFALVCAAMGCPPLRSEAYTGARLNEQLQDQAREFLLRSPKKNHVDVAGGVAFLSPVMSKYYREDFGTTDEAIAKTLSRFYPEGREKALLASGKVKIQETAYDWTLNGRQKAGGE